MISLKNRRRIIIFFFGLLILLMIGGLVAVLSDRSATSGILHIPTPMTTPGLVVYGNVQNSKGVGVENVDIYRSYAGYQGVLIATTDQNGNFQSDFYAIPGDEMVTVWAEGLGLTFEPEKYMWRHYHGYEGAECNFVAHPPNDIFLPILPSN